MPGARPPDDSVGGLASNGKAHTWSTVNHALGFPMLYVFLFLLATQITLRLSSVLCTDTGVVV